jgi:hypothetical protein
MGRFGRCCCENREKHRLEVLLGTDAGNTLRWTRRSSQAANTSRRLQSRRQIVNGAVEVHHNGGLRGRGRLKVIPNVKRESIDPFIRRHVAQGTYIYTDSHVSYKWLRECGWPLNGTVSHKKVNHTVLATTNPIEVV